MAALGEDLLSTVNKLQDLVFNTIGSDSLDLPQIVGFALGSIGVFGDSTISNLLPSRLSSVLSRPVNLQSLKTLSAGTFYLEEAASSPDDL
jgi:dynamin 1-like protein